MNPRPRTLRRRILHWVLVFLAVITALVVVTLLLLHTDWARDKVRGTIESQLQSRVNGTVSIGSLEGDMLDDIVLRDVLILDEHGQEAIKIGSIRLDYKLLPLLDRHFHAEKLEVDRLEIAARRGPDGEPILADLFIQQPDTGAAPWSATLEDIRVRGSVDLEQAGGAVERFSKVAVDGALRVRPDATELDLESISAHWVNRRIDLGASGTFDMVPGGLAMHETTLIAGTSTVHVPFAHRDQNGMFASFEATVNGVDVRKLAPGARLMSDGTIAGFASQPGPDAPARAVVFGGVGGASLAAVVDAALPPATMSAGGAVFFAGAEPHLLWGGAPAGRLSGWTSGSYAGERLAVATARLELGAEGVLRRAEVDALRLSATLEGGRVTADTRVRAPVGRVEARAVVRLPEGEGGQLTIESARAEGLVRDLGRLERLLGRPATLSGPLAFEGSARGRPDDLSVELHTSTPRFSRGDLHLLSLEIDANIAHLPRRPEGTLAVRTRDVVQGGKSHGSATIDARFARGGDRATARFAAGGRAGFSARGTAEIERLLSGAPSIRFPELAIRTRDLDWKGSGRLALGAGARRIDAGLELASAAGSLKAGAAIERRAAGLRGPVDLEADLDLKALARGLGIGPDKLKKEGPAGLEGKATVAAHLVLPAGPGTVEAKVTALSWAQVEKLDADLSASLSGRRLEAKVDAEVAKLGAIKAVLRADTPRVLTDARAWQRLRARAIESVTVDSGRIQLAALGKLIGEKRLTAGTGEVHLEAGRGLETGRLSVALAATRVLARPDLPLVFDGKAGLELAADRVVVDAHIDGKRRGTIDLDATFDRPARPFDPAAWRRAGVRAIRGIELRATRIDLAQLAPAAPGRPTPRTAKTTRGRLPAEVMEKPRVDLAGRVDLELSVGPQAKRIAGRVGLTGVRARRFAVPISGDVRLVASPRETGGNLVLSTGGSPILRGTVSTALGTDVLLAARDPDRLAARLRTTPLRADLEIPQQSISRLASLAGRWEVSGTLYGAAQLRGTVAAPVVKAELHAPGLTAEGVRFATVDIEGRYRPAGWFGAVRAEQANGGHLRLEARHGSEALAAGARRSQPLQVKLIADRFRLNFLKPLWYKPGGGLTHLDGLLAARVTATGSLDRPLVNGTLRVRQGEVRLPSMLRPIDRLQVNVDIQRSLARIEVNGRSRPGKLKLNGSFTFYRPEMSRFDMRLRARDLPVMAGTQLLSLDGNIKTEGRLRNRLWTVNTTIEKGVVLRLPEGGRATKLHETGPLDDVKFVDAAGLAEEEGRRQVKESSGAIGMRMRIRTDQRIIVRGDIIRTEFKVDLTVTTIEGQTSVTGTVDAVRGWVEIVGRRYDIERARIAFEGEMPPDPRLDIRVAHRFPQTTLYIDVLGPVSKPQVTFASDSGQYDQAQLLAMVLGGEPGEGQGEGGDASHKAAGAALAFAAGQMTTALRRSGLPVDALKVGTEAGSEQQVTYVTIGKWITDRMFIAYRRRFDADVNENANEGVFQHFFARDWMWEGAAGDRGSASVDLLWVVPF